MRKIINQIIVASVVLLTAGTSISFAGLIGTVPATPAEQAEALLQAGEKYQALVTTEAALKRAVSGQEPVDTEVANLYQVLARIHFELGEPETASRHARMALSMKEDILGPEHGDLAESLGLLADIYEELNMMKRAEVLHQREREIRARMCGVRAEPQSILAHITY